MNNQMIDYRSQGTVGGFALILISVGSGIALATAAVRPVPFQVEPRSTSALSVHRSSALDVRLVESAADAAVEADGVSELSSVFEMISNAQRPLERDFSDFLAKNIWDLM